MTIHKVTIALSKGRILQQTIPLLKKSGIEATTDIFDSRKLIFETNHDNIELLLLRATDVPVYIREGVADIGIVGKDLLLENGGIGIGEYTDLKIAQCALYLAAKKNREMNPALKIRVATKYINIASNWFAEQGQPVELIKLYGSMEIAPLIGLADFIVDLVESGKTLKANQLQPITKICDISARLAFNPTSMKTKNATITPLLKHITSYIDD